MDQLLNLARVFAIDSNSYEHAFGLYLMYLLKSNITERETIKDEFISVLLDWVQFLNLRERNEEIVTSLQQALQFFPTDCVLLTIKAKYCMKWDQPEAALNFVEAALNSNEFYVPAQKLSNSIKNTLMARWHIRMLNDATRNHAFKEAIHKKISKGATNILDIGTGSGLLSMYASCQPTHVTACDNSETMISLATKVFEANGYQNINLCNLKSTELKSEHKFDLIVTEIFDSGVFGEGLVSTLVHAIENLLKPTGELIPVKLELNIVGVHSPELASKHRVLESPFLKLPWIVNEDTLPYDTEDITNFKDLKYVTEAICWNLDLRNLKPLLDGVKIPLKLDRKDDDWIDAFVLWFKIWLDEEISIDNRPGNLSCWEQAVFYLDTPVKSPVEIELSIQDDLIKIYPIELPNLKLYRVPSSIVSFLNDSQLKNTLSKCELPSKTVLDLAPFPYLGLKLIQRNTGKLFCLDSIKDLIVDVFELNGVSSDNLTFISDVSECSDIEFDLINTNLFETDGDLSQDFMLQLPLLKKMVKSDGVLLPSSVDLHGMVVDCDWFRFVSTVDDANVGFKIAEFIKKYETNEQLDFALRHLNFKSLTKPSRLITLNLEESEEIVQDVELSVIANGNATAIVYWFEVNYVGNVCSTGLENPNSFINNAAFLIKPEMNVLVGNQIKVQTIEDSGLLSFAIVT